MSDQGPSWPNEASGETSAGESSSPPPPASPPPSSPPPSGQPDSSWQSSPSSGGSGSNDLGIRFAARLIDWVLLFLVYAFISVVLFAAAVGDAMSGGTGSGGFGFGISFAGILTSLIPGAYFIIMEGAFGGRTVGKLLLKREVRPVGGGEMDFPRAFRREWWNLLVAVPIVGPLATAGTAIFIAVGINSGDAWHDQQAGTTVVQT